MKNERDGARRALDRQLSFAFYRTANLMARVHKPLLQPLGLTFPQYLVMVELLDAGPRSVGDIGARVGMDTGTITPLLKRLEQAGFVTRRRDTEDERRVLVELTAAGLGLRDQIAEIPDQLNAACGLSDDRAAELHLMIKEMEGAVMQD